MAKKGFRYRVYVTPEQDAALRRVFGHTRWVFNQVIREREHAYQHGLPFPTQSDLSKALTGWKKTDEQAWLNEVSAVALQQALADADKAYRNFFASIKGTRKGPKVGKPRFKSKRDKRQAARFTANARFKLRVVNTERALLTLPGVPGEIRVRYSRPLPATPSSVTIMRESDGAFYVSFVVDEPATPALDPNSRHVALDLGLIDYAAIVTSDGSRRKVEAPQFLRTALRKLRHHQRALSRKEKGSNNRQKAKQQVARQHAKIRHARLDHAHQLAHRLVVENQTIAVEKLNVRGLARSGAKGKRGAGMRRAVHDAGWGQFLTVLANKAAEHGRTVVAVNPAYTSQVCSVCGLLDGPKPLRVRKWQCKGCGESLERDYNAAVNVMVAAGLAETINASWRARKTLASAGAAPVEAGTTHSLAALPRRRSTGILVVHGEEDGQPTPATAPVLALAKDAHERGVSVYFVTARVDLIDAVTRYNLTHVGYTVTGLYSRSLLDLVSDVATFKTAQRKKIETAGYDIVANIGNNTTDLTGGYADRTYKLPDYDGLLD